jgi:hypothetical protein
MKCISVISLDFIYEIVIIRENTARGSRHLIRELWGEIGEIHRVRATPESMDAVA